MELDRHDRRILEVLQVEGRISNQDLADRIGLSPSPCLARVKALEAAGVIQRYVALVNPKTLGLDLNVFINISLKEQSKSALAAFEARIAEHDEVMECYLMTGDSDYLIRVAVADMAALERFILHRGKRIVEDHPIRGMQNDARQYHRHLLVFAQLAVPTLAGIEARQVADKARALERKGVVAIREAIRRAGS